MSDYPITYLVAVPDGIRASNNQEGSSTKYPWEIMEVGASFWRECPKGKKPSDLVKILQCTGRDWARRNKPECKFVTRKELNGARIWRYA